MMTICYRTHSLLVMPRMCSCNRISEKGFQKYSELMTCLLVVEQKTSLLNNYEPFPTNHDPFMSNLGHGRGRGRGRGRAELGIIIAIVVALIIILLIKRIQLTTISGIMMKRNPRKEKVDKLVSKTE